MTDMDNNYPGEGDMKQTDFNLDDEYKPEPIAPVGVYTGVVKKVSYESSNSAILWEIVASGNIGQVMADGASPIDGSSFFYRNWLPRPGDENIRTKSGRATKRQAKINMLKRFQDDMNVDMNTPQAVQEAIMNSEWIGIPVVMSINIEEYEGVTRNSIKKISRSDEDIPLPPQVGDDDIPF
jgi:hypothetical protein